MLRQASASPQCRPARLSKSPALQRPPGRHRPRAGHQLAAAQCSVPAGCIGLSSRQSLSSSGADTVLKLGDGREPSGQVGWVLESSRSSAWALDLSGCGFAQGATAAEQGSRAPIRPGALASHQRRSLRSSTHNAADRVLCGLHRSLDWLRACVGLQAESLLDRSVDEPTENGIQQGVSKFSQRDREGSSSQGFR